jgi:hypothetical protein
MKHLLPLLLAAIPTFFFAQTPHRAWNPTFSNKMGAFAQLQDHRFVFGGQTGDASFAFGDAYLGVVNGQTLDQEIRFKPSDAENAIVQTILALPDGGWISGGSSGLCDAGSRGFIGRYKSDGTEVWFVQSSDSHELRGIYDLILQDSFVLAADLDGMQQFNLATGELIQSFPTTFSKFLRLSPSGNLLAIAGDGIYQILSNYDLVKILPNPPDAHNPLNMVALDSANELIILRTDQVMVHAKFQNGQILLLENALAPFTVYGMTARPGGFAICGFDDATGHAALFKPNLEQTGSFTLPNEHQFPLFIAADNNAIFLAGIEKHGPNAGLFDESVNFWANAYLLDGSTAFPSSDAGISQASANGIASAYYVPNPPINYQPLWTVHPPTYNVTIHNYGTSVLHSVEILASGYGIGNIYFGGACYDASYVKIPLTNLSLAPGADTTVLVNLPSSVYKPYQYAPWQVCFWTDLPNNQTDSNHANEFYCVQSTITGTSIPTAQSAFQIMPNPASDELFVEYSSGTDVANIQVVNTLGQVVRQYSTDLAFNGKIRLDVSSLPPGAFFLRIGHSTRPFVKQ